MQEEILEGGNVNQVIRIGDTVRRTLGPWSDAVHRLLRHLEARGFEGAPRFLGVDEQGREILSYIEGEVGFMPYVWSEASLVEAARLLRRYHDTTIGFVAPETANWGWVHPDSSRHEVICHLDFAPYNIVFRDEKPYALIDFDFAGPGPRVWDVAIAAYWFVPLSFGEDMGGINLQDDLDSGSRRLKLLCSTYGIEANSELLDTVEQRLEFICGLIRTRSAAGEPAWQKMLEEGHLVHWERELATFKEYRPQIEKNL